MILVNVQSRDGRECARQLCTDPDRVVLFHEWVDACLTAGKLLGDELDWGNLRIQDPEIVDENLYAEDTAPSAPKVKEEAVDGASAESNRYVELTSFGHSLLMVWKAVANAHVAYATS